MVPPEGFIESLAELTRKASEKGHHMSPWRYANRQSDALDVESTCTACDALLRLNAQNIAMPTLGGNMLQATEWPCLAVDNRSGLE